MSGDRILRERAADYLAKTRSLSALRALQTAMRSEKDYTATRAAWGLTIVPAYLGIPVLRRALHAQETRLVANAAWALGRIEHVQARKVLIAALSSRRRVVRAQAAGGLWPAAVHGFSDRRVERRLQSMLSWDKGHAALTLSHMLRNRTRVVHRKTPRAPSVFERKGGEWIR